ncbi:MAG: hypothetical protein KBC57_03730 [Neisseriaceae bacterium]|nr:hypothetical protein [Neisseriaceae bacterium]MBP6861447.1 hypothetical protein [Neisseriaceae bacterium]
MNPTQFRQAIQRLSMTLVLAASSFSWAGCDLGGHYRVSPLVNDSGQDFVMEVLPQLGQPAGAQDFWVGMQQALAVPERALTESEHRLWPLLQYEALGLNLGSQGEAEACAMGIGPEGEDFILMRLDLSQLYGRNGWGKEDLARVLLAKQGRADLRALKKTSYFLVWSFVIPTVTSGVVMVPLEKIQ